MTQYRSRQEIFDIAYLGLKGQGFVASTDDSGSCMYRGCNGLKCAVGFLIADEEYDKRLEDSVPEFSQDVRDAAHIKHSDAIFATALQDCHDYAGDPNDMQQRLLAFAKEYGLTVPGEET